MSGAHTHTTWQLNRHLTGTRRELFTSPCKEKAAAGNHSLPESLLNTTLDEVRRHNTLTPIPSIKSYLGTGRSGRRHLKLLAKGNVDQRGFDALMERLLTELKVVFLSSTARLRSSDCCQVFFSFADTFAECC